MFLKNQYMSIENPICYNNIENMQTININQIE